MAHIFISYSKLDIAFARHLRSQLQDEGFAVWMDEARLVPSERWWKTIEQNINTCDAFIVIMSPNSQTSDWVERELLVAEDQKKPIFPILLDGKRWSRLANIQYSDMTAGVGAVLRPELIEALQQVAPRFAGQSVPPPLPPAAYSTTQPPARRASSPLTIGVIAVLAVVVLALLLDRFTPREPSTTPLATISESQTAAAAALQPTDTSLPPTTAPTDTPEPSVTPQPSATLQPTLAPTDTAIPSSTPQPTITPIPPTPTPTVVVVASPTPRIFSSLRVSEQLFERGRMYYFRDTGNIWIVTYSGTDRGIWSSTSNPYRDGDPVSDPSVIAPAGRYQPIYGFGKLWRESGWRDRLGWGVTEEIYYNGRYEEHPGGTVDANGVYTSAPGYYLLESRSGSLMRFSRVDSSWQVLNN